MIVAIDGPAGAGKSTVARTLATRLGFRYLDTGAMYRALTQLALDEGLSLEDGAALGDLALREPVSFEGDRVFIQGQDVTEEIRKPRIDRVVSSVARHREVREVMRERGVEVFAIGIPKGRDVAMSAVRKFAEDARSEGLVKRVADRAGLRGTVNLE